MSTPNLFHRIRKARLFQVLAVYLGVSWVVLQVVGELTDTLRLPEWVGPVAFILLLIGLVIILATAWVQSHPLVDAREAADEVPRSWELDLPEAATALKRGRLPHLTWARAVAGGAAAFVLLFGVAGMYVIVTGRAIDLRPTAATAEEAPDGIAVLPFSVRGAGLEDWREGLVDLLSTGLDGAAGLRAIASRTVLARWHELVRDPARADQQIALEVARGTGARYALLGSAVAIGPNVRLSADILSLDDGSLVGQAQAEGPPDSVLVLVDRLAMQTLAEILRRDEADLPKIELATLTTRSLPALKAYLEGEARFRRGDFTGAAEAFERAVAIDSVFALAYHRLGQAYIWAMGITSEKGAEARDRALELVDRLPDRDGLIVRGSSFTPKFLPAGIPLLREATRKYPDDAEAWYQLGDAYMHVPAAVGSWQEARQAFERAVELAPRFASYRRHLLDAAFLQNGDSAVIARELKAYERLAPGTEQTRIYALAFEMVWGDSVGREAALETAAGLPLPERRAIHQTIFAPHFWEVDERLLGTSLPRATLDEQRGIRRFLVIGNALHRGKMRRARAHLAHPSLEESERVSLAYLVGRLTEAPAAWVDSLMSATDVRELGPGATVSYGAWAADRGRWQDHLSALARLSAITDSLRALPDSLPARRVRGLGRNLEGYGLWKKGRPEDAIEVIETAGELDPQWARFWLAALHREVGQPREAERYYRSLTTWTREPLVSYRLGLIHEELGESERARAEFEYFVSNWADADPELQPLVEDARRRLARLLSDRPR